MRTSTFNFVAQTTTGARQLTARVDYPNSVAFMYSRQPVIVTITTGAEEVAEVTMTVEGPLGSYEETRGLRNSSVSFDASRIMQLLAPSPDEAVTAWKEGGTLSVDYTIRLSCMTSIGVSAAINTTAIKVTAMRGALDQGETYGGPTERRLWVNFPQTLNLWEDNEGEMAFIVSGAGWLYPDRTTGSKCNECDFVKNLRPGSAPLEQLKAGRPLRMSVTNLRYIAEGKEEETVSRQVQLIPDCSERGEGTYLRWLNRRGELSYWLFTNSKLRVNTSMAETFERYYEGDPATPVNGNYQNPQKASYREAREMVLGATRLSLADFEYLIDLGTSPVVHRLTANANGTDRWEAVTVSAGTFERNIRRATPSLQDLEIIIELPERNTVQL